MLLNEFQKEYRKVEEQETTITQLKADFQSKLATQDSRSEQQEATIARMSKQIEALTTSLQKVSDQLQISQGAPQMVATNE